jgi:hypothetical protein
MASGPFGGGSSKSGPFGSPASGGGGGLGGFFGFIAHLGTDIKDMAFGIPAGLVHLAEHPIGSIEQMAKSTWHDWSPLFHGDLHKEWTQFMAHPLAPILDLSMIPGIVGAPFTGGASLGLDAEAGLARSAVALSDIGKASDALVAAGGKVEKLNAMTTLTHIPVERKFLPGTTSKAYIARYHPVTVPGANPGTIGVPFIKELSANPLIQARQVALSRLGGQMASLMPDWWGRTISRMGLTGGRAEAAFERGLSGREVTFQALKGKTLGAAANIVADARMQLHDLGINPDGTAMPTSFTIRGFHGGPLRGRSVYLSHDPKYAGAFVSSDAEVRLLEAEVKKPLVIHNGAEDRHFKDLAHEWATKTGLVVKGGETHDAFLAEWARSQGYDAVVRHDTGVAALARKAGHEPYKPEEVTILNPSALKPATGHPNIRSFEADAAHASAAEQRALTDYEVASHAAIAQRVKAGGWLGGVETPTGMFEGLMRFMHGQLLSHPMYTAATYKEARALMKQGFVGIRAEFPGFHAADNFEQMLQAASSTTSAKGFLSRNHLTMATNEAGHYLLVPHHAAFNWMREGKNSASFLKSLFRNPARLWKMTQVGWSPKTVMNTSVGNSFMLLMGQPRAFLYLVDGIRAMKGARAAEDMLRQTGRYEPGILTEHFSDVLHPSDAAQKAGISPISDVGQARTRLGKIARTGFYAGVHKVEQGLKSGSIIASLHAAPEVRALMRDGKSFEDAAQQALKANPMLRDRAANTALLHIGNYEAFSKREQKLKNLVPFYSWDRHIVLHTLHLLSYQPVRAAALGSVGNLGSQLTDKAFGNVPIYMRTNLPLSALGIASNKTLETIGLNPYSSIADLAGAGLGLTLGSKLGPNFAPSEDTAGQLSPLITGLIQGLTGKSILTDKAISTYGGPISTAAVNVFNNLPQVKLARLALFGAPQKTNAPLYADTFERLLSKYGGIPIQQPNLGAAAAIEAKIEKAAAGTSKKKKGPFG